MLLPIYLVDIIFEHDWLTNYWYKYNYGWFKKQEGNCISCKDLNALLESDIPDMCQEYAEDKGKI